MPENDVYGYRLTKVEDAVEACVKSIEQINTEQAVMKSDYKYIIEKLDSLSAKVDKLVDNSGDNWNALIKSAITAGSGGLVGYVLSKFLE